MVSGGVHAAALLALFFLVAWREPDPPLPEYGIELNFGLDDQGSGDVQPEQPVGDAGESTEEQIQESNPAASPDNAKPEDTAVPEQAVDPVPSKTESPVTVKEVTKQVVPSKETVKPQATQQQKDATAQPAKDNVKETADTEATKKGEAASHGDDAKKTGDKGSEEGTLDANALYGTPGGGGGGTGMNLQMSGWTWADKLEDPKFPDNESDGKVEFEIECDADGEITRITTKERTLSPKAEQLLKEMIRKNSLVRTSGGKIPERSTGKIVFVLRSR